MWPTVFQFAFRWKKTTDTGENWEWLLSFRNETHRVYPRSSFPPECLEPVLHLNVSIKRMKNYARDRALNQPTLDSQNTNFRRFNSNTLHTVTVRSVSAPALLHTLVAAVYSQGHRQGCRIATGYVGRHSELDTGEAYPSYDLLHLSKPLLPLLLTPVVLPNDVLSVFSRARLYLRS